ncbi:hypothetical protein OAP63_15305 [Vibrio sp.]|nr:hypothetical protein [Vibrio sp.]
MSIFFELCEKYSLHKSFTPYEYGWHWIYLGDSEYIQQAPEKRYVHGKTELTKETLIALHSEFGLYQQNRQNAA